jgi:hypothetical protein
MSESDAGPVYLATVPNAPLAGMVASELRANGIEVELRSTSVWGGGAAPVDSLAPVELWVRPEDVEQARTFLPEEGV